MAAIRHQGYCATSDHRFDGAHSVAAPVIGAEGFVIGCLGIGMPTLRQDDGRLPELSGLVIDAAARLSAIAQSMLAHPVLREPGPDGSPSR
jgi:DNA-binding IclR family transcriptional regulator